MFPFNHPYVANITGRLTGKESEENTNIQNDIPRIPKYSLEREWTIDAKVEYIRLSEISQTNSKLSHLCAESKKKQKNKKLLETENRFVVAWGRTGSRGLGSENGWRVQTFSYKMNKLWGWNIQQCMVLGM